MAAIKYGIRAATLEARFGDAEFVGRIEPPLRSGGDAIALPRGTRRTFRATE